MKKLNTLYYIGAALIFSSAALGCSEISEDDFYPSADGTHSITIGSASSGLTVDADVDEASFSVTSNVRWEVTSDSPWCLPSEESKTGAGDGTVKLDITPNTTGDPRTALVVVKEKGGGAADSVKVTQSVADLAVDPLSLTFTASSDSTEIRIATKIEWTAYSESDWCELSSQSGQGNDTILVRVQPNNRTQQRSNKIVIKAGAHTREVEVLQTGSSFTLTPSSLEFAATGGDPQTFEIIAAAEWTIDTSETWCKVDSHTGRGNAKISVTLEDNPNPGQREADVLVTSDQITLKVHITQRESTFSVSPTNLLFGALDDLTRQIEVTTARSWHVEHVSADWLTIENSFAAGNGYVDVIAKPNVSIMPREADIIIAAGTEVQTVHVQQSGAGFGVSTDLIELEPLGQYAGFNVLGADGWVAEIHDAAWFTLSQYEGTGATHVEITAQPNLTSASREGVITVTSNTDKVVREIRVVQLASTFAVSPLDITLGASENLRANVDVVTERNWTAIPGASWLTVEPDNGIGNGYFTIIAEPNTDNDTRQASVVVTDGGNAIKIVSVRQLSAGIPVFTTVVVLDITKTSALVKATTNIPVTHAQVRYYANGSENKEVEAVISGNQIEASLTELVNSTEYTVQVIASHNGKSTTSEPVTFTTLGQRPEEGDNTPPQ